MGPLLSPRFCFDGVFFLWLLVRFSLSLVFSVWFSSCFFWMCVVQVSSYTLRPLAAPPHSAPQVAGGPFLSPSLSLLRTDLFLFFSSSSLIFPSAASNLLLVQSRVFLRLKHYIFTSRSFFFIPYFSCSFPVAALGTSNVFITGN